MPWQNPDYPVQQITNPEAVIEATGMLGTSIHQISRSTHPLMWRWVESAVRREFPPHHPAGFHRNGFGSTNPFAMFFEGFRSSAEQFRRAMFQTPQVTTTRELDTEAVVRSRMFVDRRESAINESGDFLLAKQEGAIGDDAIVGELGELAAGTVEGRRNDEEITLFNSLGVAVEDLAAATIVLKNARERGVGARVALGGLRDGVD